MGPGPRWGTRDSQGWQCPTEHCYPWQHCRPCSQGSSVFPTRSLDAGHWPLPLSASPNPAKKTPLNKWQDIQYASWLCFIHPLATKITQSLVLPIWGRSVGTASLTWQKKTEASREKKKSLKDEDIMFDTKYPIEHEFLFLCGPISNTLHSIKSLCFGFFVCLFLPW